ncbi:hypothetical protein F2Q70_00032354 [Brassica cretica]|uniref:Uncharacterized protein n=1 Tax=Brassica cretica TaxID=69181 RepID=A0A8S9FK24_BRACR|nr:hypothetical protein F2Q70_00032354 [Brassica cretica]
MLLFHKELLPIREGHWFPLGNCPANFHSFPEDFEFPKQISLRQRYAMLGNSLGVAVVTPLLRYLFSSSPVLAVE